MIKTKRFLLYPIIRVLSSGFSDFAEQNFAKNTCIIPTKRDFLNILNRKRIDKRPGVMYLVIEEVNAYEIQNP